MDYEKKNKDAISTIKQALRQLATNGVPVGNIIKAIKDIEEKYAESEDKRIRKAILALIEWSKSYAASGISTDEAKEMIAWLKKQGEHAKFRDSIQVGDKVTRNQDGVLVNLSQLKRVAKPSDDIDTEKQGEQKPVIEIKTPEESLGISSEEYNKIVDECIFGEQKPAWSEEDDKKLNAIYSCVNSYYDGLAKMLC